MLKFIINLFRFIFNCIVTLIVTSLVMMMPGSITTGLYVMFIIFGYLFVIHLWCSLFRVGFKMRRRYFYRTGNSSVLEYRDTLDPSIKDILSDPNGVENRIKKIRRQEIIDKLLKN